MKRGKPLRADPEKVRAFQQRAQAKARERAREKPRQPLERSSGLKQGKARKTPVDRSTGRTIAEGPLTPAQWRTAVWWADKGRCVGCEQTVPIDADRYVWQAHHPIAKQRLRKERRFDIVWDPRNGIVLCTRCHERHETATERVAFEKLPERVIAFALELAKWGLDVLEKAHPATGTSRDTT